jgi:hypothetical protein
VWSVSICLGPFSFARNCAMEIAGRVTMLTVPREPSSTDRWATLSLSAAWMTVIKVVGPEHRILGDHFAAEVSDLLVYLVQAVWVAVQRLPRAFGRRRGLETGHSGASFAGFPPKGNLCRLGRILSTLNADVFLSEVEFQKRATRLSSDREYCIHLFRESPGS